MGLKMAAQQRCSKSVSLPTAKPSSTFKSRRMPAYHLQRAIANSATRRLFGYGNIQPKLSVSHPGDEHEREADRVANEIMRLTDRTTDVGQRESLQIQRVCPECAEETQLHPSIVSRRSMVKKVIKPGEEANWPTSEGSEPSEAKKPIGSGAAEKPKKD